MGEGGTFVQLKSRKLLGEYRGILPAGRIQGNKGNIYVHVQCICVHLNMYIPIYVYTHILRYIPYLFIAIYLLYTYNIYEYIYASIYTLADIYTNILTCKCKKTHLPLSFFSAASFLSIAVSSIYLSRTLGV